MKLRHKGIRIGLALLVLATGLLLAARWAGLRGLVGEGSSPIEQWCARQVGLIADDLLVPKLTFDDFDYVFPGTLTLANVRLVDGDVACLEADAMRLVLRDVPARGKPIVIDTVALTRPVVRLVIRVDGTLAGFTDFLRPSPTGAGRQHPDGGSSRPSDFLAIRTMTVEEGAFRWTSPDGTSMELDELRFDLGGRPDSDPGWYAIDATLHRPPVLELRARGRFQLDRFVLDLAELGLELALDAKSSSCLPPAVQSMLARYEVRGRLAIDGSAAVPFRAPEGATLDLGLTLTDAHFASGPVQVPLQRLAMRIGLRDRHLGLEGIEADVFDGRIDASAALDLEPALPARAQLTGHDLLLERALRETADVSTKLAGRITLEGSASAPLRGLPDGLAGSGQVTLGDGRLVGDPLFEGLMERAGRKSGGSDEGSTKFALHGDRVALTDIRLLSGSTAARGEGELLFDGRLNLRFNAGPLERAQASLGVLGDIMALVTDRIVTYQVTGTWAKPTFDVRPLGIGANAEPLEAAQ